MVVVEKVDRGQVGLRVNRFLSVCFILSKLHTHASMYFIYHRKNIFSSIGIVFNKAPSLPLYASQDIIPLTRMKEIQSIAFLRFVRLSRLGYIYRTIMEASDCNLFWVSLTFILLGWLFQFRCLVHEKPEDYLNRKKHQLNGIFQKMKEDYVVYLTNAVNYLID